MDTKLKELREAKKITQTKLSKELNFPLITYTNYENGIREPKLDVLCKLADFYNVSVDYILGRTHNNPVGYLTESQAKFVNAFLALNEHNQMRTVIYVADLLANQH